MPSIERRQCPATFQERITRAVGTNQYGEPLWKVVWGQTETFTAGGYWQHDGFLGYRQLMMSNGATDGEGDPCWMILEWRPPEKYGERPEGFYVERIGGIPVKMWRPHVPGSAAMYYWENRDEFTGLQTLGEFPYRGRYEVAFKLTTEEFSNGRMDIRHYELDGFILDWLLPMLQLAQRMTRKQRMEAAEKAKQADERAFDNNFDAATRSAKLAQGHSTQKVLDRELLMRKQMQGFLRKYGRVRPGMHQGKFRSS